MTNISWKGERDCRRPISEGQPCTVASLALKRIHTPDNCIHEPFVQLLLMESFVHNAYTTCTQYVPYEAGEIFHVYRFSAAIDKLCLLPGSLL